MASNTVRSHMPVRSHTGEAGCNNLKTAIPYLYQDQQNVKKLKQCQVSTRQLQLSTSITLDVLFPAGSNSVYAFLASLIPGHCVPI